MRVLVTGGAGYIGSIITARLLAEGHAVTVFDDLSKGHEAAIHGKATFVQGDVRDGDALSAVIRDHACRAAIHLAGLAEVAESVVQPERYTSVNTGGTRQLVGASLATGLERIVFSSTCSVYAEPEEIPIRENHPTQPLNPYGASKLAAERALRDASLASEGQLSYVALRYFNACGASGGLGEDHTPETHLIPIALRAARDGEDVRVFGGDYPTRDGTCIRDYVHVLDLAEAHIAALCGPPLNCPINLGTGRGSSVDDVIRSVERVTGRPVSREMTPRRPGDPAVLVASYSRATGLLGWKPRRSLDDAVRDASAWLNEHPRGYDN
jgi:UDP-glucose-4-epimerase GalE